jgi:hypothetical protein
MDADRRPHPVLLWSIVGSSAAGVLVALIFGLDRLWFRLFGLGLSIAVALLYIWKTRRR